MICRICQQLIVLPENCASEQAFPEFARHLNEFHADQMRELIGQQAQIMRWLMARIFTLESGMSAAFEEMTTRMVKLSQSIEAEIEQRKTDELKKVVAAHFDEADPPKPLPGRPKKR